MAKEGALVAKLRRRVKAGVVRAPPRVLRNVAKHPGHTASSWRNSVTKLVEAFPKRFWFYHPVRCGGGCIVSQPRRVVHGSTEVYQCPGGTRQEFRRFMDPKNFFRYRYGRGGEFAQGLYSVMKLLGYRVRLALGYWGGRADVLFVEVWHPWQKRWIPLDPAARHGYGHKFPKAHMKVWALEKANNKPVNRSKNYVCRKGCLPTFAESRRAL
jgi:hypothetical protein